MPDNVSECDIGNGRLLVNGPFFLGDCVVQAHLKDQGEYSIEEEWGKSLDDQR